MNGLIWEIPISEFFPLEVDLNEHVGNDCRGYERLDEVQGFGDKNE